MARLQETLDSMAPAERGVVEAQLLIWGDGANGQWQRIGQNIADETALDLQRFSGLLQRFAGALAAGTDAELAWKEACWASQFGGRRAGEQNAPFTLGRAVPFDAYAEWLAAAMDVTISAAKGRLHRIIALGKPIPAPLLRALRSTKIGRRLIWATFDRADDRAHPFVAGPRTQAFIRACLGLGHCGADVSLVLVAYERGAVDVHRPTVGDAADSHWYRPCEDPDDPHGWTQPLPTPLAGVSSRPEVVHRDPHDGGGTVEPVLPIFETVP